MKYPEPYIQYLVYFHGPRDYFECHEILEEYWKQEEAQSRKKIWVGLIQIAVSLYHHRLGNFNGAKRLMKNALTIIEKEQAIANDLGLDVEKLHDLLHSTYENQAQQIPYSSIHLPIKDQALLFQCQKNCKLNHWQWGSPSDLSNEQLVRKHTLRDRTDVIMERDQARKAKNKRRKRPF